MSGSTGAVRACPSTSVGTHEPDSGAGTAFHRWPHVSVLSLAPLQGAPACGRGHVRNVLAEWGLTRLAEDAELLASELLTNAVRASFRTGNPVCLHLLADREQLLIEVWDHNPAEPRPRHAGYEDESGRGFTVIEAVASRWGCQRVSPALKVVWAELLCEGGLR